MRVRRPVGPGILLAAVLLAAVVLMAGCQADPGRPATATPAATPAAMPTATPGMPTGTAIGTGAPGAGTPSAGSGTTSQPQSVTAEGECPYLETAQVQDIVGQHVSRTTFTTTAATPTPTSTTERLPPGCTFYRSNDEAVADIAISSYSSPVEAQTAAVQLGTPAADPIDGIADGGVVLVGASQTVLAISSGPTLLVVTINQASSLEARELAEQVVPVLP